MLALVPRGRFGRAFAPVLLLVALAVGLTACGGGSSSASSATTTTPGSTGSTGSSALASFRSCLSSHGVPSSALGDFGGRGRGGGTGASGTGSTTRPSTPRPTIPSQYASAFSACRSLLPTGGFGRNLNSAQFAAYRNCLQLNGVTLPTSPTTTPGQSGSGGGFGAGSEFNQLRNNPKFQAAEKACRNLLPAGGRGGSGSSTTTTS